jgi:apolipoprotein N-acyltransferase
MTLRAEPRYTEAIPNPRPPFESAVPSERRPLRWFSKLGLIALSTVLLSLSFAPFKQFYLAWIGLAPLLLVIADARSATRAMLWGWLAGFLFFFVSVCYLLLHTIPGAFAAPAYLALFWGTAAVVLRGALRCEQSGRNTIATLRSAIAIATIWVAFDWLRGNTLFALPWLYLGHTQTPLPALCQIADLTGVYGVTFFVALINALVAIAVRDRLRNWRSMLPAWGAAAAVVIAVAGYGLFRLSESQTYPGPHVMVIQPNDPMRRGGGKSVTQEQSLQFHLGTTLDALKSGHVDLIVWSETTMPPLNAEAREALHTSSSGPFLQRVHAALRAVATNADAGLIAGGYSVGGWAESGGKRGTDIRNTAFFYDRSGQQVARYDKIHLMPFGEVIPFGDSIPPLHRLLVWLGPHSEEYALHPGDRNALTVFTLRTRDNAVSRFVSPICFDDLDAPVMTAMFRGEGGAAGRGAGGGKRADFIVNLTNDGWFHWFEPEQHLQVATFRSIENRAPTARAVNTGVSAFIDSCGRVLSTVTVHTTGTLVGVIELDRRVTFYTRYGDVFAVVCITGCCAIVAAAVARRARSRMNHT